MNKSGVVTALFLFCALLAVDTAEASLGGQLAEFLIRVFKNTDEVPLKQKGAGHGSGQGAASSEGPEVGKEEVVSKEENMRDIDPYQECMIAAERKKIMSRGAAIKGKGGGLTQGSLQKILDTTSRAYCAELMVCGLLLTEDDMWIDYRTIDFDSCMWGEKNGYDQSI